jgi:predicted nucleotide-binding protein (sugar kinase/HSP70/actin superfamily)
MKQERKAALPRYGEYNCALKYLVEQGFETKCILPPPLSRRTEDLGAKNSPDLVCTPFKTTLGSMIEALEAGADTIIMVLGACRLNYFGELQEQILRDLGYTFDFINLSIYNTGKKRDILRALKGINPRCSMVKAGKALYEAVQMIEHLDDITSLYYQNCGFDPTGTYPKIYRQFISDMYAAQNLAEIREGYRNASRAFAEITLHKPQDPIRIGIIGDYYTVMDPFSNLEIEQKLADMGVEVHRLMNITNDMLRNSEKNKQAKIREFSEYSMGASSTSDLWQAQNFAERGFDGLIQVKSACCMPETDIMPVLANLSQDYKMPVLYLTYDTQSSDVGLTTRLEAFYDMVEMRKKVAH